MATPCGVGIDVAKATLDVAWSTDPLACWQLANEETGWAALVAHVRTLHPTVIVLEATGGYEIGAASALATAGPAGRDRQSAPGSGLCQGTGSVGKDRCH
jgi:transposase